MIKASRFQASGSLGREILLLVQLYRAETEDVFEFADRHRGHGQRFRTPRLKHLLVVELQCPRDGHDRRQRERGNGTYLLHLEPQPLDEAGRPKGGPLNRRAEMWMKSREWLEDPAGAAIPDRDSLQADACGPGYKYDSHTRLQLESKEEMRRRGAKSPDEWDAVALTFAEPVIEQTRWPKPRPIRGIGLDAPRQQRAAPT